MNNITLVGRIGKDPETKFFDSGTSKTTTTLAVDRRVKGEKVTDWFNLEIWGKQGETLAEYAQKGKQVAVSGSMVNEKWQDRDGNNRDGWKVNVRDFTLLGGKDEGGGQSSAPARSPAAPSPARPAAPAAAAEEIPF